MKFYLLGNVINQFGLFHFSIDQGLNLLSIETLKNQEFEFYK
ncbi:MAG: hypothetical protein FD155_1833 [Bacteroidetes bacterium]|nr:MAG: hypothetical protein FD155_1833 [Bacteroidota bacterium]